VKDIVPYRSLKVSLNHATVMAIEVNARTGWEALTVGPLARYIYFVPSWNEFVLSKMKCFEVKRTCNLLMKSDVLFPRVRHQQLKQISHRNVDAYIRVDFVIYSERVHGLQSKATAHVRIERVLNTIVSEHPKTLETVGLMA
jgi:hypothetical protein